MARKKTQTILSVLLVEGPTEVVFYNKVKELYLKNTKIEHLNGNSNINRKVLDKITWKYSDRLIRVYCCVDRESRNGRVPNLDLDLIREEIVTKQFHNVLSIDSIEAIQMIESWFFYDVPGIYTFLKTPKAKRAVRKFNPPEKNDCKTLGKLYRDQNKHYIKGYKTEGLVKSLDIPKIYNSCQELKNGVDLINRQASDPTNHLF